MPQARPLDMAALSHQEGKEWETCGLYFRPRRLPLCPDADEIEPIYLRGMKTVSPDLFGVAPWAWLVVPLLCLLLVRILDRDSKMRASGLGLVATSLMIFSAVALTRWQDFI